MVNFFKIFSNLNELSLSETIEMYNSVSNIFLGVVAILVSIVAIMIPVCREKKQIRLRIENEKQNLEINIVKFEYNIETAQIFLYVTFINHSLSPITVVNSKMRAISSNVQNYSVYYATCDFIKEPIHFARDTSTTGKVHNNRTLNELLPINLNGNSSYGCYLTYSYNKEYVLDPAEPSYRDKFNVEFQTNLYPIFLSIDISKESLDGKVIDISINQTKTTEF